MTREKRNHIRHHQPQKPTVRESGVAPRTRRPGFLVEPLFDALPDRLSTARSTPNDPVLRELLSEKRPQVLGWLVFSDTRSFQVNEQDQLFRCLRSSCSIFARYRPTEWFLPSRLPPYTKWVMSWDMARTACRAAARPKNISGGSSAASGSYGCEKVKADTQSKKAPNRSPGHAARNTTSDSSSTMVG